jgi:hypothetical protein
MAEAIIAMIETRITGLRNLATAATTTPATEGTFKSSSLGAATESTAKATTATATIPAVTTEAIGIMAADTTIVGAIMAISTCVNATAKPDTTIAEISDIAKMAEDTNLDAITGINEIMSDH